MITLSLYHTRVTKTSKHLILVPIRYIMKPMDSLTLNFLGTFHIELAAHPVTRFGTDKTRGLLAYLVLEADRAHRREKLADLLWPEQPNPAARHSLRQALVRLRDALGDAAPAILTITPATIRFNATTPHMLDCAEFAGLLQTCQNHAHHRLEDCAACIARLRQAVELYRGELLQPLFLGDSLPFEEWMLVRREALHRQALETLYTLAAHHETRGEYTATRRYAARQIELEPWREEAHRQLMRALASEEQRSAALAQYDACQKILAREFGAAPAAETQTLGEQIRNGTFCAIAPARSQRVALNVSDPGATLEAAVHPSDDDLEAQCAGLGLTALLCLAQGRLAEAHDYQLRALALQTRLGDRAQIAASHFQLGVIAHKQNDLPRATETHRRALALREQIGDKIGIGASCAALGQIELQCGNFAEALTHLNRALAIQRDVGNRLALAALLARMGECARGQGDEASATDYFRRAAEIQ